MLATQLGAALLAPLALASGLSAQIMLAPTTAAAEAAAAGAFATEPGGFVLKIPGVADDLIGFADAAFDLRPDGTARLSVYLQRQSSITSEFYLTLEFSGLLRPGDAGYPPAPPVTTMLPAAYAPVGPVDPSTFEYWSQVTGTLTGLRTFAGVELLATAAAPAQRGAGANNRNERDGLALDLNLAVSQQSTTNPVVPTGPAQLRVELLPDHHWCLAHVDSTLTASGGTLRLGVELPGIAGDYVWSPAGDYMEAGDGSARLTGTLRRQADYTDSWRLHLTLTGRVLPGDPSHPPTPGPITQLLPTSYRNQGGPIDPDAWRYFTAATGTLTGEGRNAGGLLALATAAPAQVGLGAAQGNHFFGVTCATTVAVVQQPTTNPIAPTGNMSLHANLSRDCLLPTPVVNGGISQVVASVNQTRLVFTGTDLGFCEQFALGPFIMGTDEREWRDGHLHIVDQNTVEVSIRQGLPPALYPARLLQTTTMSNPLTVDVRAPTTVTLRSERDRQAGETQHWLCHQGPVQGFAFCFLILSGSNLPSSFPGVIDLQIGNQFSDYVVLDVQVHDPASGVAEFVVPAVPPTLANLRLHAQAALMDATFFPLIPSDAWFTDY